MKISDYLSWFDSIMDRFQAIPRRAWNEYDPPKHTFDHIESQSWVSEAGRVDLGGCPPRSPTDPGLHITRTRFLSYDFAALRNRLWTTRGLGKP